MFKMENLLPPLNTGLEGIEHLSVYPIRELELGYVYKRKDIDKKEFFQVRKKHLVHTQVLKKFISRYAKSQASEKIKKGFIEQATWWIEVRAWLQKAYLFAFDSAT